jgi:hypothetical protein
MKPVSEAPSSIAFGHFRVLPHFGRDCAAVLLLHVLADFVVIPVAQCLGARIPGQRVPPRSDPEPEVGHFAEGERFDEILLALARRDPR